MFSWHNHKMSAPVRFAYAQLDDLYGDVWGMVARYLTSREFAGWAIAIRRRPDADDVVRRAIARYVRGNVDVTLFVPQNSLMRWYSGNPTYDELVRLYPHIPEWSEEVSCRFGTGVLFQLPLTSARFSQLCDWMVGNHRLGRIEFGGRASLTNEFVAMLAERMHEMRALRMLSVGRTGATNIDLFVPGPPEDGHPYKITILSYCGCAFNDVATLQRVSDALRLNTSLETMYIDTSSAAAMRIFWEAFQNFHGGPDRPVNMTLRRFIYVGMFTGPVPPGLNAIDNILEARRVANGWD